MEDIELAQAIDGLYEAFAGYPRPATFTGCGCCFDGRVLPGQYFANTSQPLVEVDAPGGQGPLPTIPSRDLHDLAVNMPATGGTSQILKHYLPRLLDIVTADGFEYDWPSREVVFSRLAVPPEMRGDPWWNWPRSEQVAVQTLLDALWVRDRRSDGETADDTLCAIGLAARDIRPFLEAWSTDDDPAAVAALISFRRLNSSGPWNAFWDQDHDPGLTNRDHLVAWLDRLND